MMWPISAALFGDHRYSHSSCAHFSARQTAELYRKRLLAQIHSLWRSWFPGAWNEALDVTKTICCPQDQICL